VVVKSYVTNCGQIDGRSIHPFQAIQNQVAFTGIAAVFRLIDRVPQFHMPYYYS
jgi:hypothetical protein